MNRHELTAKYIDNMLGTEISDIQSISLEVPFFYFRRKADILVIRNNETFAIEVKSQKDNLRKLSNQLDDYKKSFNYVSVLVDGTHYPKVKEKLPSRVGLIVYSSGLFETVRKPKLAVRLNKEPIVGSFKKQELIRNFSSASGLRSSETSTIREYICKHESSKDVTEKYVQLLLNNTVEHYQNFLIERHNVTLSDDLLMLSNRTDFGR